MKSYNNVDMKGRLYNFALQTISTDKGDALSGDVMLEVDADGTIVTIRYFGYPVYNNGKVNKTYGVLDEMVAGNYKTVVDNGDDADWLACTGSIDIGYFVAKNNTDDELARAQKIRGAFINANNDKAYNNKWKLDLLITNISEVDADEEKQLPRYVKVGGYLIDGYNERLMEVQFQARTEKSMDYILGLEASYDNPYFVGTWGKIDKIKRLVVHKNAFGEDATDEYSSTQWVITGMNPQSHDFGDEAAMTTDDYAAYRIKLEEYKEEQKNKDTDETKPALAF